MIPPILIEMAWIIILARCGYRALTLFKISYGKPWLDILFNLAVALIALSFLI
jgi:hypothetical protein